VLERLNLSDPASLYILFRAFQTLQEFFAKKTKIGCQLFKSIGIHLDQNVVVPFLDCKF